MQIINGLVYVDDGRFMKADISVEEERIVHISDSRGNINDSETVIDADGMYVIPGLTDLHLHGCVGADFSEGSVKNIEKIVDYQRKNGITTICPATMTLPMESLEEISRSVRDYTENGGDGLAGFHMEGPFINPEKCGAQNPELCISPDIAKFHTLNHMSGDAVRIVTIAPELDGADAFIREISKDAVVSIGHSRADYAKTCQAFAMGACHVTHMYNAMDAWNHREPGISGAAFDYKNVTVELICDGYHLHPSVIRGAFAQFGDDRIVLISDSTMATGMPDGKYTLGGQPIVCKEKRTMLSDGTLAGSASNLLDCFRYAVKEAHIPLESVVKCATINPTKILKKDENYGSLSCGKYANILLLNKDLELVSVVYRGKIVNRRE